MAGFTNKTYIKNGEFVVEKIRNKFNHKYDYKILERFDFIPKLIFDDWSISRWELIEGKIPDKFTDEHLEKIAKMLREVHTSDIKLPKNKFRNRAFEYFKLINEKGIKVAEINDNFKEMNKLISRMSYLNPCHNDVWKNNFMEDENGKLFLVDWEYATMGDKHFDLAYLIESEKLSPHQEKVFLDAYNATETFDAYIAEWMPKYKKFVHWLIVCWAYAQEKMPFDLTPNLYFLNNNKRPEN